MRHTVKLLLLSCAVFAVTTTAQADTAIETETAQIGRQGDLAISQSVEFAHSSEGHSGGTLTQIEYGLSDRAELLIEPFFYLWEHPAGEEKVSGRGDLEITPSYMVVTESGAVPAVLLATKVKVPTGSEDVGGTGKYDYFPYVILGQHYGGWTFNANLGVNFAKREDEGGYDKQTVWDLEAEHELLPDLTGFIEVFSAEEGVKTASAALEYQVGKHLNLFCALGYTREHEVIVRPGFNLQFY